MRIVQINSYSNGSTGHIASAIHKASLAQGDESLFAYGMGPEVAESGYRIGSKQDFFLHTAATLLSGLHGYFSHLQTKKLIQKIKEFHPDIVHLHNLHGGYLHIGLLLDYLIESNVEIVMTLHDCWIYTGKCYHYYEAGCDRYLKNCGNCPQLSMYPKSCFFDFTKKMLCDKKRRLIEAEKLHLITVSDWLQEEVKTTFLGKYPVVTISNGVSPAFRQISGEQIDRRRSDLGNQFIILGVASSWNLHKGIIDFLKLAKCLSADEKIVLVGHMMENLELPENILKIDHTENVEEMVEIYNAASVFVSMSTEETFGLSIAEALCCGTPAVVYNATACGEMIRNGWNGYTAAPHNVEQVYDYIQKIKNSHDMDNAKIAEKARETYSAKRMQEAYLSLYRGIKQ